MSDTHDTDQTYDLSLLRKSEEKWKQSEGLRLVYGSMYASLQKHMVEGESLELGSGIGGIKAFIPDVVTTDLEKTPYVDAVCSAYEIVPPASDEKGKWSNIIAVDVLHHLRQPMAFFEEASRMLRQGGRILLMEPAGTLFGRLFYGLFHQEPISPKDIVPPFEFQPNQGPIEFANMAMGTSLFVEHESLVERTLAEVDLQLAALHYRDLLAYPLSGGYSAPQMLPTPVLKGILSLEKQLPQWALKWMALRVLIVIEKH